MATAPDVFDGLMNSTCSVMVKGVSGAEGYNQPSQTLSPVSGLENVPCRFSTLKGGKEYKSGKEYSINTFRVFMRPQTPPVTTHNWLVVTTQSGHTYTLNILSVDDPSGMGHHIELYCELVNP